MKITNHVPELPAYLYHGQSMGNLADYYLIWCPYCLRIHWHTAENGHQQAHYNLHGNSNADSPYSATGYILKGVGTLQPQ